MLEKFTDVGNRPGITILLLFKCVKSLPFLSFSPFDRCVQITFLAFRNVTLFYCYSKYSNKWIITQWHGHNGSGITCYNTRFSLQCILAML